MRRGVAIGLELRRPRLCIAVSDSPCEIRLGPLTANSDLAPFTFPNFHYRRAVGTERTAPAAYARLGVRHPATGIGPRDHVLRAYKLL